MRREYQENESLEEESAQSPVEQGATDSGHRRGIIVNSSIVSVRMCASEASPVQNYLKGGETVEILEKTFSGFFLVRYGKTKQVGYVSVNCCREV